MKTKPKELPRVLTLDYVRRLIRKNTATHDDWATVAGAEKIKAAVKVPMELHVYDAQHAFCNERRPEVYNAEAAKQAWDRALSFIRSHTK